MAKVLVVEDDPDIAELVSIRLRAEGHEVKTAGRGAEALEIVEQRGAPDVAVLDVTLPTMSGFELLEKLREALGDPGLPAVFLSGRVGPEDIDAGRALGARYLTKPFVASALLRAVDELARRRQPENSGW